MKRSLIVMLLLAIFAGGCAKKSDTSVPDSLSPAVGKPHGKTDKPFLQPTTQIMPAAVDNSSDMTITMAGANGTTAMVSCYFSQGAANQSVAVSYNLGAVATRVTFTSTNLRGWSCLPVSIPSNATNVKVVAGVAAGGAGVHYTHSESYPVAGPPAGGDPTQNLMGVDISKYSDDVAAPNTDIVYVAVQDAAVTTP